VTVVDDRPSSLARLAIIAACGVVILAGMRAAAPVIGPVVIALLITIAWSPGSQWLQRHGWPPAAAALMGIVLGVIAIGLVVLLLWSSLVELQRKLPEFQPRLTELRSLAEGLVARLPVDTSGWLSGDSLQPGAIVSRALGIIGGLTSTLGNLFFLVLIMAFLMLEGVRYPQKLRDAVAGHHVATERLDAFVHSLRSYVLINFSFGLVTGTLNTVLLLALNVEFAVLWGVLSFLLCFIPNVGFALALIPPTLLALLQFGFTRALLVVATFSAVEFVVDTIIKPRFVGGSLDLSPAVVVLSLVFWGWLLGATGAVLAVPLSIVARYFFESFPELRWLAHLMSDRGAGHAGLRLNDS
jgi:AI-2 transport protein TqsA